MTIILLYMGWPGAVPAKFPAPVRSSGQKFDAQRRIFYRARVAWCRFSGDQCARAQRTPTNPVHDPDSEPETV